MPLPLTYPIGHAFPDELPAVARRAPHAPPAHIAADELESRGVGRPAPILLGTLSLAVLVLTMLAGLAWLFHPATNPIVAMANKPAELLAAANMLPPVEGQFNRMDATRSLDMAAPGAAVGCGVVARPGQTLPLEVTFAPDGRVSLVRLLSGPLAGTHEGDCIARALEQTPAAPFVGPGVTLTQSIPLHAPALP